MSGKRVCAWCKEDMGDAPDLPGGQVMHGACKRCLTIQLCKVQPITYYACGNYCTVTGQPAPERCKHGREQLGASDV